MKNLKSGVTVKTLVLGFVFALCLVTVAPVAAAPITGVLNIQGSVMVSQNEIDWYLPVNGGYGEFTTKDPDSGYFEQIVQGLSDPVIGEILDLGGLTGPIVPPLPGGTPLEGFLDNFSNNDDPEYSDLSFTLESLIIPAVAECQNQFYAEGATCRLGVFLLTQGSQGVQVKLEVFGSFVDLTYGDDGSLNDATGLFSTTLNQSQWDTIAEI